jgi:hypothetical protein
MPAGCRERLRAITLAEENALYRCLDKLLEHKTALFRN